MRSLNVKKERQYSEDGGRGNLPRETGGVPVLTALLMPTAAKKGAFECLNVSSCGITIHELKALKTLPSPRWCFINKRPRLAGLNSQLPIWQVSKTSFHALDYYTLPTTIHLITRDTEIQPSFVFTVGRTQRQN